MRIIKAVALLSIALVSCSGWSIEINGFNTSSGVISAETIIRTGPVDSPIQVLESVQTQPISETDWLLADFVIGIKLGDEARAYPLAIMMWHQIVNDELGENPVLVTFCRICGTGLVFDRFVDDQPLVFGMSGLIYEGDILLYDKQTNSLWSRFLDEAVSGPLQGQLIFDLPYEITTVGEWQKSHPESTIVSRDTGFDIDYSITPTGVSSEGESIFAALPSELRYHVDMPVLGISQNGVAKAYPAAEVLARGGKVIDEFEGVRLVIEYSVTDQVFHHQANASLQIVQTNWADWISLYPKTAAFAAGSKTTRHKHPKR